MRPTRQGTCRTADKQSDRAVGFAAICPPIAPPLFPVFLVAVAMRLRFRLVGRNRERRWYGQRRRRECKHDIAPGRLPYFGLYGCRFPFPFVQRFLNGWTKDKI